jgi:hypothetical protein
MEKEGINKETKEQKWEKLGFTSLPLALSS